jgi:ubiquinone/menaquinone biosynthesis C-methylase UbiE
MGWYGDQVLPRVIDLSMRGSELARVRARVLATLDGEVLEIGFGSGLNVPYYPAAVTGILAVDPARVGRALAAKRLAACPAPVKFVGAGAQTLPVDDESVGNVLSTWTLCSIPDVNRALAEIRRVLRPGGTLHFAEHGLAPDPKVARLQHRLTPLQRRLAGGCHLDRPIGQLLTSSGLELTRMDTYYMKGPRVVGYTFEGIAAKP